MSSYTIPCYCPCLYSVTYTNPHDCRIGSPSLIHCRTCTHKYTSIYNGQYHSPSQRSDRPIHHTAKYQSSPMHCVCCLQQHTHEQEQCQERQTAMEPPLQALHNQSLISSGPQAWVHVNMSKLQPKTMNFITVFYYSIFY